MALFYAVAPACYHCGSGPLKGLGVASGCFEIGKANLASHLRRAIGADVEAFASPEERVLETIPSPVRGAASKGIGERSNLAGKRESFREAESNGTKKAKDDNPIGVILRNSMWDAALREDTPCTSKMSNNVLRTDRTMVKYPFDGISKHISDGQNLDLGTILVVRNAIGHDQFSQRRSIDTFSSRA